MIELPKLHLTRGIDGGLILQAQFPTFTHAVCASKEDNPSSDEDMVVLTSLLLKNLGYWLNEKAKSDFENAT